LGVPASPSFRYSLAGTVAQGLSLPDAPDWPQEVQPVLPFPEAQQVQPVLPFPEAPAFPQDALLQQHLASVVGVGEESFAMTGEHPLIQPDGSPARDGPSEYDEDVSEALAVLDLLRTGPSVPPLPPSGCYGGVFVSSAISEGLGAAAAGAAEAAAREFGGQPVKLLLPWYPPHAGVAMFDKTTPAKIAPTY